MRTECIAPEAQRHENPPSLAVDIVGVKPRLIDNHAQDLVAQPFVEQASLNQVPDVARREWL